MLDSFIFRGGTNIGSKSYLEPVLLACNLSIPLVSFRKKSLSNDLAKWLRSEIRKLLRPFHQLHENFSHAQRKTATKLGCLPSRPKIDYALKLGLLSIEEIAARNWKQFQAWKFWLGSYSFVLPCWIMQVVTWHLSPEMNPIMQMSSQQSWQPTDWCTEL